MYNAKKYDILKSIFTNPQIILAKPSLNLFLMRYMKKFSVKDIDGNLILHSHLPPLNSKAFTRFIDKHLLNKDVGPSHAQIGLTNACPQRCDYCYNKNRSGKLMDKNTIINVINDLKSMGVFWIGLTGGEPLLNKDIVEIIENIGDSCTVKLFTTGCNLTKQLANDMRQAGLLYVSISLDHWIEEKHDKIRSYNGAFKTALIAIEIFKNQPKVHVSVSSVISKEMIKNNEVEEFIQFLKNLGVHEAWLSEAKPSVESYFKQDMVITDEERQYLIKIQDENNKNGNMTINYLGHFESEQHFGCTAGHKMVFIDPFGEVSPCVFIPMTFGNVQNSSVKTIYENMSNYFPSEEKCFINKNYDILNNYYKGNSIIDKEDSKKIMNEVNFEPYSHFFQMKYK